MREIKGNPVNASCRVRGSEFTCCNFMHVVVALSETPTTSPQPVEGAPRPPPKVRGRIPATGQVQAWPIGVLCRLGACSGHVRCSIQDLPGAPVSPVLDGNSCGSPRR